MTVGALANRAELEAFFAASEARLADLDGRIDGGYQRLARRKACDGWGIVEALEVEREEIILRTEEAFAMLETMTDDEGINADGGIVPDAGFVFESFRNPRAPLPHEWDWPAIVPHYELNEAERRAQGLPPAEAYEVPARPALFPVFFGKGRTA